MGFEEPHIRLIILLVERDFSEFPIVLNMRLVSVG